jgi:twitching motility protein PilT
MKPRDTTPLTPRDATPIGSSSAPPVDLAALLRGMEAMQASDLHLVAGHPPMYRVHGTLAPVGPAAIAPDAVGPMLATVAPPEALARLDKATDVDFALSLPGGPRFRANVFIARGQIGACFRAIPTRLPGFDELGFPTDLGERIAALNSGLVLVTGVTGSGKTTTLAALIALLNLRGGHRILTIEEPIEYVHAPTPGSIVTQREVGDDVASFYDGLRFGLRQDPDVILVGEIRDRDTAQLAMSADAKGAVTRLIDLFPPEQHDDIRTQLSLSLQAVIAQHLLPGEHSGRRVLALEVMLGSFAVRSAIRAGKTEQLESAIQSGRKDGMFTLDADLRRLLDAGCISLETARSHAKDPAEFGG